MTQKSKAKLNGTCMLVVDANVLVRDFWWKGPAPSYLLERLFLMHALVIPEIALAEAANNIERRAEALLARIDESTLTPRLLGQYQSLFNKETKDDETAKSLSLRYKKYVKALVKRNKGLIAPTPKIPIAKIVERSLKRTKPFNNGDKGFRDTLIWLGVLDIAKEHHRISFVSENINDFSDSGKQLHPDLLREVQDIIPEYISFKYFRSLNEFIVSFDSDGSGTADAFTRAVMTGSYKGFNLVDWIEENLLELLKWRELDGVEWAGMPYHAENPRLAELQDLVGLEVRFDAESKGDKVEFYCDIAIVGLFICTIFGSEWESVVHPLQVEWVDDESNAHWIEIAVRSIGTFTLRLVFDLKSETIVDSGITALEHKYAEAKDALVEMKEDDAEESED